MKHISYYILFLALTLASCSTPTGTTITGEISDAENVTIFFDKIELQTKNILDKAESNGSGKFKFNFPDGLAPGLYGVRAGARTGHLILDGNESEVVLTGTTEDLNKDSYTVSGSDLTSEYVQSMTDYRNKNIRIEDVVMKAQNADPLLGLLLALRTMGSNTKYAEAHLTVSKNLKEKYPTYDMGAEYQKYADQVYKTYLREKATQKVRIGEEAPEIAQADPDGVTRKLSDLKGKIVLLDFWASWCGPCRRENPNVVKTYKKYKDQGFTVFSVSLDGVDGRTEQRLGSAEKVAQFKSSSKDKWLAAIEKDQLEWNTHVSDLKKWDSSAAAKYGVRSIPRTFLIDRDGKIAALNPRRNLEEELLKLL